MVNRILSLIGWIGTAMVFVAVAIRFGYPVKEQWAYYLAWGGLVCVLVYTLGQWREIAKVFSRRQTRYGTLMGGCFISLGLFISSLTKNQIVAGMVTFAVFLLLWIITWIGSFSGPTVDKLTQYLSIVDHYDDFGKGVLDTTHFIYYVSFITFGLFLTAKSVDSERWRG